MEAKRPRVARDPEERQAKRAKLRAQRAEKFAKKEAQVLKKIERAAKKAKDFETRKLRRRLKLLEEAESQGISHGDIAGPANSNPEAPESANLSNRMRRLRYETSNKESLTKQLATIQQLEVQQILQLARKELPRGSTTSEGDVEGSNADAPDSVPDGPVEQLAAKLVKQKGVQSELADGKELLGTMRSKTDKWEGKLIKSEQKAARRAAAAAEREAERIARGEPAKEERDDQDQSLSAEYAKLRANSGAGRNKKGKLKKQKRESQQGGRNVRKDPGALKAAGVQKQSKRKAKLDRNRKKDKGKGNPVAESSEALHPSWAAKKQQKGSIDQGNVAKGKKTVFNE